MSPRHWLLLLALSLIWGATFPIAKYSVGTIPPLVLTFFRVLLAALTLHMVLRLRGIAFPLERRLFGAFLLMGLLNNAIPFSLIFWGQTVLPASLASILNATTPIFTVLVASLVFGQERLAAHRVAGILIGFLGVAILLAAGLDVGILQGVARFPMRLPRLSPSGSGGCRFSSRPPASSPARASSWRRWHSRRPSVSSGADHFGSRSPDRASGWRLSRSGSCVPRLPI